MAVTGKRLQTPWAVGHRSCWTPVPHWLPGRPAVLGCPKRPCAITPIESRALCERQSLQSMECLLIGCSLVMVLPSCSLGLPGMPLRPGSVVCSLQVLLTTGGPSDVGMLNGWRRHWGCLGITLVRLTTLP